MYSKACKLSRLSRSDPSDKKKALISIEKTLLANLPFIAQQRGLEVKNAYDYISSEDLDVYFRLDGEIAKVSYDGSIEYSYEDGVGSLDSNILDRITIRTMALSNLLKRSGQADYYNHLVLETNLEKLSDEERKEIEKWASKYKDINIVVKGRNL